MNAPCYPQPQQPCPPYPPAPPFPSNPVPGQSFGTWTWNGTAWVPSALAPMTINVKVFQGGAPAQGGSFTYTPSPGLVSVTVECIGGGGGGGGAVASIANSSAIGWIGAGGGGSSGGYSRKTLPASIVMGGVAVTVGAGGAGGTGATATVGTGNGLNGGPTSFGAFCVANGGIGGYAFNAADQFGFGGPSPQPGVGDVATYGAAGFWGESDYWDGGVGGAPVAGGHGGTGFLPGAGQGTATLGGGTVSSPGNPGSQGNGGAGGASGLNTVVSDGGAGGGGVCIVTETCVATALTGGPGYASGCAPVAWPAPCC